LLDGFPVPRDDVVDETGRFGSAQPGRRGDPLDHVVVHEPIVPMKTPNDKNLPEIGQILVFGVDRCAS
jgi:hypothetical protein